MSRLAPVLRVAEIDDRVRLGLDGIGYAEGASLQEAADALVHKLLVAGMTLRSDGISAAGARLFDPAALNFLWELGEIAARGGDIRDRLFA
jgi:hypothetical protein